MEEQKSLSLLAAALAGINGIILVVIAGLYFVRPTALHGLAQVELLAGLSLIATLYYGSLHQYFKKLHQAYSTLALTLISSFNLVLVIAQTGGLDSPFYSFWLLVIVASGIFGSIYTLGALAATIGVHLLVFAMHGFNSSYVIAHIPQLAVTMAAAGLAEWVYYRGVKRLQKSTQHLNGQLDEEQLKAQALMASMTDGVIVVDRSGKVQVLNQSAQTLTGWTEESVKDINYRVALNLKNAADKDISDTDDPFVQAWNFNQGVVKNSLSMMTRAGRKIAISISVSPMYNPEKQIAGAIAVFRDISKEKEVERQRNEFVSTASHEMRTPVAAIEGYIALAMNPKVATIDDRAKSFLEKAHENTQHLGELFRDLLSITKLEEGIIAKHLAPVDLSQMLKAITTDMQFAASKKDLSITFAPTAKGAERNILPIYMVMVDEERMREVVMNLIENGIKYTQAGGITVSLSGDDKTVTVRVQDTGPGIAQEDIAHLFQKFYRVDSSATRTVGGTGLGLYLCRTVIELFNGRIWAESEIGKGSSFNFTLPRLASDQVPDAAPQTAPTPAAPEAPKAQPVPIPMPALATENSGTAKVVASAK